jgi:hypothetical protein
MEPIVDPPDRCRFGEARRSRSNRDTSSIRRGDASQGTRRAVIGNSKPATGTARQR